MAPQYLFSYLLCMTLLTCHVSRGTAQVTGQHAIPPLIWAKVCKPLQNFLGKVVTSADLNSVSCHLSLLGQGGGSCCCCCDDDDDDVTLSLSRMMKWIFSWVLLILQTVDTQHITPQLVGGDIVNSTLHLKLSILCPSITTPCIHTTCCINTHYYTENKMDSCVVSGLMQLSAVWGPPSTYPAPVSAILSWVCGQYLALNQANIWAAWWMVDQRSPTPGLDTSAGQISTHGLRRYLLLSI